MGTAEPSSLTIRLNPLNPEGGNLTPRPPEIMSGGSFLTHD